MSYEKFELINFCDYLYKSVEIPFHNPDVTESEMYNYLKHITCNFDKTCFGYVLNDIKGFAYKMEFSYPNNLPKPKMEIEPDTGYPTLESESQMENYKTYVDYSVNNIWCEYFEFIGLKFEDNQTLSERVSIIKKEIPKASFYIGLDKLLRFSEIAELEYNRMTESTPAEIEPTLIGIKRPNNTHNVQVALLERLGVIDYLKKEYPTLNTTTKMGELIANIINRSIKNTTEMVRYSGTKNQESNLPKNQDIVTDILIKTGVNQKD